MYSSFWTTMNPITQKCNKFGSNFGQFWGTLYIACKNCDVTGSVCARFYPLMLAGACTEISSIDCNIYILYCGIWHHYKPRDGYKTVKPPLFCMALLALMCSQLELYTQDPPSCTNLAMHLCKYMYMPFSSRMGGLTITETDHNYPIYLYSISRVQISEIK